MPRLQMVWREAKGAKKAKNGGTFEMGTDVLHIVVIGAGAETDASSDVGVEGMSKVDHPSERGMKPARSVVVRPRVDAVYHQPVSHLALVRTKISRHSPRLLI